MPDITILTPDTDGYTTLRNQLAQFGFSTRQFTSIEALAGALDSQRPKASLVDLDMLDSSTETAARLWELHNQEGRLVPLISYSSEGDLPRRLFGVRCGGQAFLVRPLDINILVERIHSVLAVPEDSAPFSILVIEDSELQSQIISMALTSAGMSTRVVNDPLRVNEVLKDLSPDLILMDLYMPQCSGLELARVIRQQDDCVGVPIVYLSAESNLDRQIAALGRGGDDFLTKPIEPMHLISAVTARVRRSRAVRAQIVRDGLSGLYNHTYILSRLETEISRALRSGSRLCFAMLDLDNFKAVNDTHGHPIGDRVLKTVARLLTQRLRRSDVIGRYGGEEFAIIMPDVTPRDAWSRLDEIREAFSKIPIRTRTGEFHVTLSCGITGIGGPISDVTTAKVAADEALYEAKEGGRNQIRLAGASVSVA